ncbi:MAG: hypothetical protein KAR07_10430 [Spirochaetes bacterium]|nr:hypothetical protein [Spirochaetota bacterium]
MKVLSLILFFIFFPVSFNMAEIIDQNKYTDLPQIVLKRLHKEAFSKGEELYRLKNYKESLPYLDKAIVLSKIIIQNAMLGTKALRLLREARYLIKKVKMKYRR